MSKYIIIDAKLKFYSRKIGRFKIFVSLALWHTSIWHTTK